ncbi:MAG: hypothetical protein RLZZ490_504 [Cyanobacteriota bacterium]|jgi:hypothetical protein
MPRSRRKSAEITLDLFPFLSILACTIGTLILLIIVMTMQSMDEQQEVTIIAKQEKGQNSQKSPRYWEAAENGVILYPQKTLVPFNDLKTSPVLKAALDQLSQNRDQEYLIIAVRPGGIETFRDLRNLVESLGIDIGYEPLDEGWQLKFETES